jgi:small subunit ribosomal protein S1
LDKENIKEDKQLMIEAKDPQDPQMEVREGSEEGTGDAEQVILQDDSEDFAKLYEESIRELREREVVTGTVVGISNDGVLVDVGYKSEGIIPKSQFQDDQGDLTIEVGDTVEVFLEKKEDSEGLIYLSKEKADKMKIWNEIGQAYEDNIPVKGKIISRIKGGLTVDIGVRAFLPGSQVDIRPIRNLDRLVGEDFFFKIIKFNPRRGNVVLSRRVLLEEERENKKGETLKVIEENAVMEGIVKNITDYGAFIDLGGIDGLLHITDLSWGRLQHPSEMLAVGDRIEVKILKFDRDKERVSLGMKQLTDDPWESVPSKYPVGSRVSGKTMSVTDYGAFIKLEDGVEGLVHISEMTWNRKIKHPSKVVEVGDTVEAEVLSIDTENRRISLGMKQIEPNPWDLVADNYPIGSMIEGKVRTLTDFGAFVGLEEGIDGLIHVSDISWIQKVNHPSEILKKGDTVKAVVMSVDKERERLSLGLKQLTPNPWEELVKNHPAGTVVAGKVVNHADFGTFVELAEGVEGLIHISEMELDDGQSAEESYPSGSEVTVKILNIDPEERKVSLSINAVKEGQEVTHYSNYVNAGGGGTLGDILGESLAAHRAGEAPSEPGTIQEEEQEAAPAQDELEREGTEDPDQSSETEEAFVPDTQEEQVDEEDEQDTAADEEPERDGIEDPDDASETEEAEPEDSESVDMDEDDKA